MATTITITSSYAGEAAGQYFSAGIKEAKTIKDGLVTVLENVPYKRALRKYASADGTVDFSCTFVPGGSVTLSEKVLAPKKLSRDIEICKNEFVDDWDALSMGASAHNDNIPATIEDYLIGTEMEKQVSKIDKDIWQGLSGTTGQFGGFIPAWTADSDVVDVTGVTITAANVIAELSKVIDATADVVVDAPDFVWVVSTNVARAYSRALSALGFQNLGYNGEKTMDFEGFKLDVVPNLPANTMATYRKSNLYFGTGLLSDHNEIKIKDMSDVDLSNNVRMRMVYSGGVQYVDGTEIVMYKVA